MLTVRNCRSRILSFAFGATLLAAGHAGATSVTTTSFTTWKTNLTGSPSEANFSVIQLTSYNTAAGLTLPTIGNTSVGTTVTGPDAAVYKMTGADYQSLKSLEGSTDSGAGLYISLPNGGVNAFLLGLGTTGNTPLTVTVSDGETFTTSNGLFGISISHTVSSLLITTSSGSQAVLDDFWYGTSNLTQDSGSTTGSSSGPQPVAEVASSLMIAGGFLFIFGAWRRFGTPNPA